VYVVSCRGVEPRYFDADRGKQCGTIITLVFRFKLLGFTLGSRMRMMTAAKRFGLYSELRACRGGQMRSGLGSSSWFPKSRGGAWIYICSTREQDAGTCSAICLRSSLHPKDTVATTFCKVGTIPLGCLFKSTCGFTCSDILPFFYELLAVKRDSFRHKHARGSSLSTSAPLLHLLAMTINLSLLSGLDKPRARCLDPKNLRRTRSQRDPEHNQPDSGK